jgi:hypothetical protein
MMMMKKKKMMMIDHLSIFQGYNILVVCTMSSIKYLFASLQIQSEVFLCNHSKEAFLY